MNRIIGGNEKKMKRHIPTATEAASRTTQGYPGAPPAVAPKPIYTLLMSLFLLIFSLVGIVVLPIGFAAAIIYVAWLWWRIVVRGR